MADPAHKFVVTEPSRDDIVVLHGVSWQTYLRLLKERGDRSAPRLAFDGSALEIMAPSENHESIKSLIGRLVETYCLDRDIDVRPVGSWTLKRQPKRKGVEPDECYVFGPKGAAAKPDLAIEVEWTAGGLDKLPIYADLGVREVWVWREGVIRVHLLRRGKYSTAKRSQVLPGIDLALVCRCLDAPTLNAAVRRFQAAARKRP